MARAPQLGLYEQRGGARGSQTPGAPRIDASSAATSIGQALARVGQEVGRAADLDVELQRVARAREEDDARALASRVSVEARAHGAQILREAPANAPDGWRDLTSSVAQQWAQYRDERLAQEDLTPSARVFMTDVLNAYQAQLFDSAAETEQNGRSQWQADTIASSIDAGEGVLAADPSQYEALRAEQLSVLEGLGDAHQRRVLSDRLEERYARAAVAGMIEADPRAALRQLQDENAGGPFARLGSARAGAIGEAQNEIERRNARWRADVRASAEGVSYQLSLGMAPPPDAPSIDTVERALGPQYAAAYGAELQAHGARSRMRQMSQEDLFAARTRQPSGDLGERQTIEAERVAAAAIMDERQTDFMQALMRDGYVEDGDAVLSGLAEGNYDALGSRLRTRVAVARDRGEALGVNAPSPLTRTEAALVRQRLDQASPNQRVAELAALRTALGGVRVSAPRARERNAAYEALVAQIYADDPAAEAGARAVFRPGAVAGVNGAEAGRYLMEGARLLRGEAAGDGAPSSGGARRASAGMPSNAALRAAFNAHAGDAFAGAPDQEDAARAAFAAYLAGAADLRGVELSSVTVNQGQVVSPDPAAMALIQEARRVVIGDVRANREPAPGLPSRSPLPWGVDEEAFHDRLRRGWSAIKEAYAGADLSRDPRDYDYAPLPGRDGYYVVYRRGAPVEDRAGRPVVVIAGGPGQ